MWSIILFLLQFISKKNITFKEKDLWLIFEQLFKKWANPGLFFIYFCLFKHTLQFLQQINVKKCPSSMWWRDSNSRPLEHESPPITTRPGLPPCQPNFFIPFE